MIKFNKKIAFSLAESLISMMLLTLTIVLTMTSITKKKHHPAMKASVSGMYACWNDGTGLKQMRFDGNRQVEGDGGNPASVSECSFEMDRRASEYYIYAVGARKEYDGKYVDGQIDQKTYKVPGGANEAMMKLKINLGNYTSGVPNVGNTIVTDSSDTVIVSAMGNAIVNNSGVIPANVEKCKYISGAPCGEQDVDYNKTCNVASSDVNTQNEVYAANIKCADKESGLIDSDKSCSIYLSSLKASGDLYSYEGKCGSKDVVIKIVEKDPSFKAIHTDIKKSKFVKLLKMIPQTRQTGLTESLLKYYLGDGNTQAKNGVVLIVW